MIPETTSTLPPGELVPDDVPQRDFLDEVHARAHRAGYCTRDGGPIPRKIQATCNWGERRFNLWPRDKDGNLIE